MSIVLIVLGIVIGGWGAKAARTIESQRPVIFTGPVGTLLMPVAQFGGAALLIWGLVSLFT
jgi:hypothetical protein